MAVTGTMGGVINFTASNDMLTGNFLLDSCRWVGATAAGQLCLVTDLKGNPVFVSEANGANFVDGWVFKRKSVDGIYISSMNSGSFQVYRSGN
jgi:hypothetical protein